MWNSEVLNLDWDKTICELSWVFTGLEILWERSFEILWEMVLKEKEDSSFFELEISWEAIPEGGRPKMLDYSEAGCFIVAWIALRSFGVREIDSTHCWISRALEESTLLWSWLTMSNQDFIGFSAERGNFIRDNFICLNFLFIFLFARHLYLFCKNSLVKTFGREFSFPLINSISKSNILKIACHLAKISLDAIFWRNKVQFGP